MRTIAVTEDRSSPTATSRRRSALEEASMDGAVLMSFLTVLGLAGDAWVGGSLSDLPARPGRGGCLARHPQHPQPVDQESEQRTSAVICVETEKTPSTRLAETVAPSTGSRSPAAT